ncbi:MAG: sigma-70 family RNA polymerase sigma factor [Oscillospiraceae bacterium]|nr:sigma-70 family RNA polymerase sigma factor [Oscillospiraceae bacterium]
MEDSEIIGLYFERDERAISETGVKYGRLCFGVAKNILGSSEDAEECVNDTYLNVWNSIPPTKPNDLKAFICKVTRNLSLTRLKYNKAAKRSPEVLLSLSELEEVLPDESAADGVEAEELGKLISAFLREQKPDSRNVFLRRYWFFDSVSEIAARFSFSESKVKSMLFHTRGKLRKYLKNEGIDI